MSDHTWASEEEVRAEIRARTVLSSEATIIAETREALGESVDSLLGALNALWGHGFATESSGNEASPTGHFFRVEHWIVTTDYRGFQSVQAFPSIEAAIVAYERMDEEYCAWDEDEDYDSL